MTRRVKGTQDLLNMQAYDAFITAAHTHFTKANFSHIQTPILEYADLFHHSIGQHTDIVSKEMYTFSVNDKETLCLRPEATASTMRAYTDNAIIEKPWKVFTHGPMFRHERPQKGRWRQFSQFNLECIGLSSIAQDAQFLSTLENFFTNVLKLHDFVLSINFLGTPDDRAAHRTALLAFVQTKRTDLCTTCQDRIENNLLRIFDCKNPDCIALYKEAPHITDYLSEASATEWQLLNHYLDILSISRVHNPYLVRGLDYYHKTVFEFSSPLLGAQNAFCGGGQYDLSKQLQLGKQVPAIGAAIGIERLLLLLEAAGAALPIPQPDPLYLIIPFEEEQVALALLTYQTLQQAGMRSEISLNGIKKGLSKADKEGACCAILIGENEQKQSTVSIKNMSSGSVKIISQAELVSFLQKPQ